MTRTGLQRQWKFVYLPILMVGILTIVMGLVFNPAFIERYVSSDHNIDPVTVKKIYFFEALALAVGLLIIGIARVWKNYSPAKEKITINILILTGSTIFTLVLLEIALKIFNSYIKPFERPRHAFFQYDEILGWKLKPNKKAFLKNTKVEINGHGLRDKEIPYKKPAGEFRIQFLGDSQLFGDGIEENDTFASLMENSVKSVCTINSGVIGYGTDQQFLAFKNDGIKYSPDLIIVTLNALDFLDNISDKVRSGYSKPVFKVEGNELIEMNIPVPKFDITQQMDRAFKNLSHIYYFASVGFKGFSSRFFQSAAPRYATDSILPPESQLDDSIEVTQRILKEIGLTGKKIQARTLVVFLPYAFDFSNEFEDYNAKMKLIYGKITEYSRQNSFIFLDIRPELQKKFESNLYLDDMHLSKEGHKQVADILLKLLVRQNLLPNS